MTTEDIKKDVDFIFNLMQKNKAIMTTMNKGYIKYILKFGHYNSIVHRDKGFCFWQKNDDTALVYKFAVEDNMKGTGFATELMKEVEQKAKEIGLKKVVLYVRKNNERAIAFYNKMGFTDIAYNIGKPSCNKMIKEI